LVITTGPQIEADVITEIFCDAVSLKLVAYKFRYSVSYLCVNFNCRMTNYELLRWSKCNHVTLVIIARCTLERVTGPCNVTCCTMQLVSTMLHDYFRS